MPINNEYYNNLLKSLYTDDIQTTLGTKGIEYNVGSETVKVWESPRNNYHYWRDQYIETGDLMALYNMVDAITDESVLDLV
jgi:hypothetical protein